MKKLCNYRPILFFALSLIVGGYIFVAIRNFSFLIYVVAGLVLATIAISLCILVKSKNSYVSIRILSLFVLPFLIGGMVCEFAVQKKFDNYKRAGQYFIQGEVVSGGSLDNYYAMTLTDVKLISINDLNEVIELNHDCYVKRFMIDDCSEVNTGDTICFLGEYRYTYDTYLTASPVNADSSIGTIIYNGNMEVKQGSGVKYNLLKWSKQQLSQNMDKSEAMVAYAMLFGDKDLLNTEIKDSYSATGLSHVLAVSGLHVGFIILLLGFIFKKLIKNPWVYLIVLTVFLIGYAYLCSWSPSIIRAIVMCAIILISKACFMQYDGLNALAFAGIINFIISPLNIFNIGFLLSFSVVFAIFSISPQISRILSEKLPKKLNSGISLSVSAWLGGIPITIFYFKSLSVVAIILNIIVIPLVSIIFISLICCLLLSIIPATSALFLFIPKLMLKGLNFISSVYGNLSGAVININESYLLLVLGMLLILFMGEYIFVKKKWSYSTTLALGLVACLLVYNAG